MDFVKLNTVKDENWPWIRRFVNVNGVKAGKKITGGVETDEDAVVVFVTQKLPKGHADLKKRDIVPERIDGVKTDIIQVGEIWALSMVPIPKAVSTGIDRTRKFDPVLGGISTGHPNITAGTLSIVQDTDQGVFYLSNAHVFSDCNDGYKGDYLCQPGKYDDPAYVLNYFAELHEWVPIYFEGGNGGQCPFTNLALSTLNGIARSLGSYQRFYSKNIRAEDKNYVDAAIAKPLLNYRNYDALNILEVGKVTGIEDPVLGMRAEKSGRSSAVNDGTVNGVDVTVTVNYGDKGIATLYKQGTTTPMLIGGDSGSHILNKANKKAIGLGFAGSGHISIFNPIRTVWELFKLNPVFPK